MKKLRYGIIGIQGFGKIHLRYAQENPNLELVAVADKDKAGLEWIDKPIKTFTDHRDLLESGLVDAVSIVTPHYLHAPIAMDCLQTGVHVFVEKPISLNVPEGQKLIDEAKKRNLIITVGHQYRTFQSAIKMKDVIDTGQLGKILRVLWTWFEFRSKGYYQNPWKANSQYAGGGVLVNQAIHDVDLMRWLLGMPCEVQAMMGNQFKNGDIDDIFSINMRYSNGMLVTFQMSLNQAKCFNTRQISGDRGILIMPNVNSLTWDHSEKMFIGKYEDKISLLNPFNHHFQPKIQWKDIGNKRWYHTPIRLLRKMGLISSPEHGTKKLIDNFVNAIQKRSQLIVSAESSLETVKLINTIQLAAKEKKTILL